MKPLKIKTSLAGIALVAMTVAGSSFGQKESGYGGGGRMRAAGYDPSTEMTVKGQVEEVQEISGRRGWAGIHLKLKTDTGTFDVHLGPSFFLKGRGFSIAKDDELEVTGSKVEYERGKAIVARVVKMGDRTLTLRDAKGFPLWSRRGSGSQ